MNRCVPVILVSGLLSFVILLASCSSSLGDVPFDVVAEGVVEPVSCASPDDFRLVERCSPHPLVSSATALEAMEKLEEVASAALGVDRVWAGSLIGVGIGRDGRNLDSGLSGWSTAWVAGTAADPDMLVLDTTAGVCRVQNRCTCVTNGTCPGFEPADVDGAQIPTVDSGAAITAAFPDDTAAAAYDLSYDGETGLWTVTRAAVVLPVDAYAADTVELPEVIESSDIVAD